MPIRTSPLSPCPYLSLSCYPSRAFLLPPLSFSDQNNRNSILLPWKAKAQNHKMQKIQSSQINSTIGSEKTPKFRHHRIQRRMNNPNGLTCRWKLANEWSLNRSINLWICLFLGLFCVNFGKAELGLSKVEVEVEAQEPLACGGWNIRNPPFYL